MPSESLATRQRLRIADVTATRSTACSPATGWGHSSTGFTEDRYTTVPAVAKDAADRIADVVSLGGEAVEARRRRPR